MSLAPYIGITGVTTQNEAEAIIGFFRSSSYQGMLGFAVSQERSGGRYIRPQRIPLIDHESVLTCIHYNTQQTETLAEQIDDLLRVVAPDCIQINCHWPDPRQLKSIKQEYPSVKLILQLRDYEGLAERIKPYRFADAVLLDSSLGRGLPIDIKKAICAYSDLAEYSICIGFAGGFDGTNAYQRIRQIRTEIGDVKFAIDAESRLRKDDKLDLNEVEKYVQESMRAFNS